MLTFEEFFKKKKIDLAALQQAQPALFIEFETHYAQMGEKSFDHTKKYWFNNLRRQYHLAIDVQADKLRNENRLAEQTIVDTLNVPSRNAPLEEQPATYQDKPKVGFTPKFRAAIVPKPVDDAQQPKAEPTAENIPAEEKPALPKIGFTPKFRAANVPKPAEDMQQPQAEPTSENPPAEEKPAAPKMGFTPKFRASNAPKPVEDAQQPEAEPQKEDAPDNSSPDTPTPKPAFKPRFNMKNMPPKPPQD